MGEEIPKKEEKKEEDVKEEKKEEEEEKKDEEKEKEEEIVLKVDMHCEACARKVARALKGFQGVEEVRADCKASKVVVKGKGADPIKVCQRIQKKTGRKVEIISPLPPQNDNNKQHNNNDDPQPQPQENKQDLQPPAVITLVLKVRMHCEACAQVLQKKIRKVQGVESVTTDIANNQVMVKGVLDPDKVVSDVYKRTGKQASIVKEEEKKKEEEENKDEKQEEKKEEEEESKEEDDKKTTDTKKMEYWPSKYYMDHAYAYAPQMFSDENPNACFVM